MDTGEVSVDVESFTAPSLCKIPLPPIRGDPHPAPPTPEPGPPATAPKTLDFALDDDPWLYPNSTLAAVLLSTSPSYVGESTPSSEPDRTPERWVCLLLRPDVDADAGTVARDGARGEGGICELRETGTEVVDAPSSVSGSLSSSDLY